MQCRGLSHFLGLPHPILEHQGPCHLSFRPSFLLKCTLRGSSSRTWVPDTHTGNPDSSHRLRVEALGQRTSKWKISPALPLRVCHSLSLPFKQMRMNSLKKKVAGSVLFFVLVDSTQQLTLQSFELYKYFSVCICKGDKSKLKRPQITPTKYKNISQTLVFKIETVNKLFHSINIYQVICLI